jgi:hypothetical protein
MESRPLKIGLTRYRETSARNYHYSLLNNPEERSSDPSRSGSLKSKLVRVYLSVIVITLQIIRVNI